MRKRLEILALTLLCSLIAPASWAQEQQRAPERATYDPSTWPAASAARVGADPASVQPAGWTRTDLQIDPRRGEASFGLAQAKASCAAIRVRLRLHASVDAARQALIGTLRTVQAPLSSEEGLGDVAFGGRVLGRLEYAAGALGNVTFVVRALAKVDVTDVAVAVSDALRAAPALEGDPRPFTPRVLGLTPTRPAVAGEPTPLRLDLDPTGPEPLLTAVVCLEGASVVQTELGFTLYAAQPGLVTIEVFVCTQGLRVGTKAFALEVTPR